MSYRLGLDAKLYRNTGSFASPSWNEIKNVKDLTLSVEKSEADVTTRGNGGWEAIVGALKKGSVEFDMVWDTADDDFTAIRQAFFNNTQLELAIMDGDIAVAGAQGLRATMEVLKFNRTENLEEALMAEVTVKPAFAANPPSWLTV